MKSSFYATIEEDGCDGTLVERLAKDIAQISFKRHHIAMSNRQLLDLGMKIQSVINQIDKENREIDEKGLMDTEVVDRDGAPYE